MLRRPRRGVTDPEIWRELWIRLDNQAMEFHPDEFRLHAHEIERDGPGRLVEFRFVSDVTDDSGALRMPWVISGTASWRSSAVVVIETLELRRPRSQHLPAAEARISRKVLDALPLDELEAEIRTWCMMQRYDEMELKAGPDDDIDFDELHAINKNATWQGRPKGTTSIDWPTRLHDVADICIAYQQVRKARGTTVWEYARTRLGQHTCTETTFRKWIAEARARRILDADKAHYARGENYARP